MGLILQKMQIYALFITCRKSHFCHFLLANKKMCHEGLGGGGGEANLEHANIFTSCDAAVHPLASVVLCSYRLYVFNFFTSLHELTFIPNSIAIQISWPVSKKKEIFQNLFATLDFKRDILHNSTVLCFELIQMQARLFIYERQGKDTPLVTSHMIATVTTWEQRILQSCKL